MPEGLSSLEPVIRRARAFSRNKIVWMKSFFDRSFVRQFADDSPNNVVVLRVKNYSFYQKAKRHNERTNIIVPKKRSAVVGRARRSDGTESVM